MEFEVFIKVVLLLFAYVLGFLVYQENHEHSEGVAYESIVWPLFVIKWAIKYLVMMAVHVFKKLFLHW